MNNFTRTHTCGALRESDIGKEVILSGWVHKHRNFGGILFIDIRDRYGRTQIVIGPEQELVFPIAEKLRLEDVVTIRGKVVARQDINPALSTGKIEILPETMEVLSRAQVCPFTISDAVTEVNEELRLKYRYLDMRRGKILDALIMRHKAMMAVRQFMDSHGFVEVVTPILGKSTPEGARDYLVPSRIYPGTFYALPQSPQMFKQLLMIGGLDRYFQIALCFRDEDSRADRQPEFSQIDIEMSFATQEELFPIIETLAQCIFSIKGVTLPKKFKRMTHAECMEKYGTDKPDLRYGMEFHLLNDLAAASTFQVFHNILAQKGIVKGFCVRGGAEISRKVLDEYGAFVAQFGLSGLVWVKLQHGTFTSNAAKFFGAQQQELSQRLQLQEHDLGLIVAGSAKNVHQGLDHLRRKIAKERNLASPSQYEFLWVTDFPLFAYNEQEGRLESEHHPFTSPKLEDIELIETEPLLMRSSSYDLVLNGYEIASGSQRIHDSALQDAIFTTLGMAAEERVHKFGFFLEALRYGTPPHLGIALGFDRICMMLSEVDGIKDVIAFPKTQRAQDLMMDAPSAVGESQLKELHVYTNKIKN